MHACRSFRCCGGLLVFLLIAVQANAVAQPQATTTAAYELTFDAAPFPRATVSAELEVVDGTLSMFSGLNDAFPESGGFAAFVRQLRVSTLDGRPIEATRDGSKWQLRGFESGRVRLCYVVDLRYASRRFATGNEQIALSDGDGLFVTGFALFITSGADGPVIIQIDAPGGSDVTTSWRELGNRRYLARDHKALLRNILASGRGYHSERLVRNSIELRLLLFGPHRQAAHGVRSVLLPVMDYYARVFRHSEPGHFTFALLPGPNDGEGYIDSFASSQPEAPGPDHRLVWANSLAHEFFHFWNGGRIASTWEHYPERQWFSEGVTEYYANKALLETGIIDQRTYDELLSQYLSVHLLFATNGAFSEVTMREAGRRKGLYRPGVYDSGVAVGFCLDGIIRETSEGTRSLDDLMRLLDGRFGSTGRPIVFEDIAAAAAQVSDGRTGSFFARHVEGREPLPVARCAERMGYRALVDGYHVLLRPQ